jgi:hypothetical protein
MKLPDAALKAFKGESLDEPVRLSIKIDDKKHQVFIGFGFISVPSVRFDMNRLGEIEKRYDCRTRISGNGCVVVPESAAEIIDREGVLCSSIEEHRKVLDEWFRKHAGKVIGLLIAGE